MKIQDFACFRAAARSCRAIVTTRNITQSAIVGRSAKWTTVLACAVLLFD